MYYFITAQEAASAAVEAQQHDGAEEVFQKIQSACVGGEESIKILYFNLVAGVDYTDEAGMVLAAQQKMAGRQASGRRLLELGYHVKTELEPHEGGYYGYVEVSWSHLMT